MANVLVIYDLAMKGGLAYDISGILLCYLLSSAGTLQPGRQFICEEVTESRCSAYRSFKN